MSFYKIKTLQADEKSFCKIKTLQTYAKMSFIRKKILQTDDKIITIM